MFLSKLFNILFGNEYRSSNSFIFVFRECNPLLNFIFQNLNINFEFKKLKQLSSFSNISDNFEIIWFSVSSLQFSSELKVFIDKFKS